MISPREFVAQWHDTKLAELDEQEDVGWGLSPLVRYDARVIEKLKLPIASERFLIEAGLPTHAFMWWRFGYPSGTLPPITEAIEGWTYPEHYARYRVLAAGVMEVERKAYTEEAILNVVCLDLAQNGRVVNVMTLPGNPVEFLNSSVVQFAEFILIYRQLREWYLAHKLKLDWDTDYDEWEQEGIRYAEDIFERLLQIDPAAGQPGTGWHGELTLGPHEQS